MKPVVICVIGEAVAPPAEVLAALRALRHAVAHLDMTAHPEAVDLIPSFVRASAALGVPGFPELWRGWCSDPPAVEAPVRLAFQPVSLVSLPAWPSV